MKNEIDRRTFLKTSAIGVIAASALPSIATTEESTRRWAKHQLDFLRSDARFRSIIGGRGCGKTEVASYDLVARCKPNGSCLVVAPSRLMIENVVMPALCKSARELGVFREAVWPAERLCTVFLSHGGTISCVAPSNVIRHKWRFDYRWDGIWLEEPPLFEGGNKMLCAVLPSQCWITATFTPKGKDWAYREFFLNRDWTVFHARTRDNPFYPREREESLRSYYSEVEAAQELDGLFVSPA